MSPFQRTAIIDAICQALCTEDRGDAEGYEGYVDLAEVALLAIEDVASITPNTQTRDDTPANEPPAMITAPHTMDAQVWAKKWLETLAEHPDIATDEGAMTGWFANAIMAGYDQAQRGKEA